MFNIFEKFQISSLAGNLGIVTIYSGVANKKVEDNIIDGVEVLDLEDNNYIYKRIHRNSRRYILNKHFTFYK